jgi:hypothetical protein
MTSRSLTDTLRDLRAAEDLARCLEATAPGVVMLEGGGDALVRRHGRPTGAGFWTLQPFPEPFWEAMAREHAQGLDASLWRPA